MSLCDVLQAHSRDTTLVIKAAQRFIPKLARLVRELELVIHHQVNANIYLSPPHSRGFSTHYDSHDVFVLQTCGSKFWKIYPAASLFPTFDGTSSQVQTPDASPLHEATLRPGELAYIPRGFVHEAVTVDDWSLHLTVGILPTTWLHVLQTFARNRV